MPLSDKELKDVLMRADEIHRARVSVSDRDAELRSLIASAEEAGYDRSAVELALREKLELPVAPPAVGDLVFVRSADKKYYAAHVLSHSAEGARVRFLRGGEHVVAPDQLRPGSLMPGDQVLVNWPAWGTWRCALMAYDTAQARVKLSDRWGSERWFKVSEVWLERPTDAEASGNALVYVTLTAVSAAVGGVVGALITAMLLR